jgi:hypothetical protein
VTFKSKYSRRYYGYEEHDFVTGLQNDHAMSIGERKRMSIRHGLGILELDRKRCELKTERRIELSQHEC